MFDDYQMGDDSDSFGYSREKFLTKLQNTVTVLESINDGKGPEVILFQELEADFTPETSVTDFDAFLAQHSNRSVASMLTEQWSDDYAGYSSAAWLLKALSDAGLEGYEVASVPSHGMDSGIAHANAVFSKFPIRDVERHRLVQARDILEARLDIDGHPLYVYVNHWKSGASNPEREPIRVENARILRKLLDARLKEEPDADILVAGDLNSHYNHSILFPDIETGINDVLGSSGAENFSQSDLYNLWFELSPEARYSEVWRGRRGSLMHMLVTPGLYDEEGISYIDGSFDKLVIPGLNADIIGRPLEWHFAGKTGGGASDHFPILARFKVGAFEATGKFSAGLDAPDFERPLGVDDFLDQLDLPDGHFLNQFNDAELAPYVARLYTVDATVESLRPLRLKVDDRVWAFYYADRSMIEEGGLPDYMKNNDGRVRLVVRPNFYYGKRQFIIESILGGW